MICSVGNPSSCRKRMIYGIDGTWDTVHFDLDCNENLVRLHFTIVCLHVVAKPLSKVTSLCSSTQ